MFQVWIFLMGIITTSESLLLSGMTASIKTYSEHFPWLISEGNSSSSRFDNNTDTPTTLKDYINELPTEYMYNNKNYSSGIWENSKVVVVARVGDYDNETGGEWAIIAEPKKRNETLNNNKKNGSEKIIESSDYFLGNDDIQKYMNDYQDLLYTFKDFVKIGASPSIKKNISQYNHSNQSNEKIFNVTYVMPIPKTKKYFEIKLSNLTKPQYIEINALLQNHILKKTNPTEIIKNKEQEVFYVDEKTMGKNFVSHTLMDALSSKNQTSKPLLHNSRFTKDLLSKNEPIPDRDFFGPLLTPEGFNYFLNNFDSIHINLNNTSADQTIFQTSNSTPTLLKNNGFHAEIATDYVKRDDLNVKNPQEDPFSQQNYKDFQQVSEQVGSRRAILNPHPRINRTKLFSQNRSKRPIMNAPNIALYTEKSKISPTSVSILEPLTTTDSSTLQTISSNNNLKSSFNHVNISSVPEVDKPLETTRIWNTPQNTTKKDIDISEKNSSANFSAQNWLEMQTLLNNSLITANKTSKPFYVMEAAEWLLDMKRKIEEEERKKTERYKSYIKHYLGGDEGSFLLGRGNNGNIMKINKEENILEELKMLMLDYFSSLNFKTQEATNNNTFSAAQLILNATNIFELMEQSSQLVKLNLDMKLQTDIQEPTKFVKQIVEKQVEKCKKIFDKELFVGANQKPLGSTKKSGHRRFMGFTKCMNYKLKRCIKGFSLWLEKGRFFLRPHFKLNRAYENYEIERNLYCLRNYNPSVLGSNPHGVRVKPGPKVSRKSGPWKIGARQHKKRFGTKTNKNNKLKHKQRNRKFARPNIGKNRRYKQQQISKRPKIQRYTDQQQEDAIMTM